MIPVKMHSKYPSQSTIMATYGFNKYALADKMRNHMHIPDNYLQALRVYKIVHDVGNCLRHVVDGQFKYTIIRDATRMYNVIYHNCTPYNAKRAKEIRLSFRAAQDEFNLEPIVLIEIVQAADPQGLDIQGGNYL